MEKVVLITGASGTVGSALVPLLLLEQGTFVRIIVRAQSTQHLAERLALLRSFWGLDSSVNESDRLQAFSGDVCDPLLGLEETVYGQLTREVTHVIHSAGNVKLNQSMEEARRSAVGSAKNILAFSQGCNRLEKLEMVSTVGVAGRMRGSVPEEPMTAPREFRNSYEAAKAEAEQLVLRESAGRLPVTIHRPSMVVGDSKTGKVISMQVFYYLSEFLAGKKTDGIVPDAGPVTLDIIPVDYVARAILIACSRHDSAGRIFHLCSGPLDALPVNTMGEILHRIYAGFGESLAPLQRVPSERFNILLRDLMERSSERDRRFLQGLPLLLEYLGEAQTFDNTISRRYFSSHGLEVPPVREYLKPVIEFYASHSKAKR